MFDDPSVFVSGHVVDDGKPRNHWKHLLLAPPEIILPIPDHAITIPVLAERIKRRTWSSTEFHTKHKETMRQRRNAATCKSRFKKFGCVGKKEFFSLAALSFRCRLSRCDRAPTGKLRSSPLHKASLAVRRYFPSSFSSAGPSGFLTSFADFSNFLKFSNLTAAERSEKKDDKIRKDCFGRKIKHHANEDSETKRFVFWWTRTRQSVLPKLGSQTVSCEAKDTRSCVHPRGSNSSFTEILLVRTRAVHDSQENLETTVPSHSSFAAQNVLLL